MSVILLVWLLNYCSLCETSLLCSFQSRSMNEETFWQCFLVIWMFLDLFLTQLFTLIYSSWLLCSFLVPKTRDHFFFVLVSHQLHKYTDFIPTDFSGLFSRCQRFGSSLWFKSAYWRFSCIVAELVLTERWHWSYSAKPAAQGTYLPWVIYWLRKLSWGVNLPLALQTHDVDSNTFRKLKFWSGDLLIQPPHCDIFMYR